jgi:hypothetical protein
VKVYHEHMQLWDRFRRRLCADIIRRDTMMAEARASAAEHKFNIVRGELTHLRDLLMAKARQQAGKDSSESKESKESSGPDAA